MLRTAKVSFLTVMVGIVFSAGFCVFADGVNDNLIMASFQDSLNKNLYPNEMSVYKMTSEEAKKYVLPHAAIIIFDTIRDVYKKTKQDIGVENVLSVLPPAVENVLREKQKEITVKVNELLNIDN